MSLFYAQAIWLPSGCKRHCRVKFGISRPRDEGRATIRLQRELMGRMDENGLIIARGELTGAMELFSLRGDLDFHWLRPADVVTWPGRGGVPVTYSWPEPSLTPCHDDSGEVFLPVDCFSLNAECDGLILSEVARNVLEDKLLQAGELWPVRVLGRRYWWFNCLATVKALDAAMTEADWEIVDGEWGEFRWITQPRRLSFVPTMLATAPAMFRVPEFPQGVLFAGEQVLETVALHGLTGFQFDPVWSEAAGGVWEPAGFGFSEAFKATPPAKLERKRAEVRRILQQRRPPASGQG